MNKLLHVRIHAHFGADSCGSSMSGIYGGIGGERHKLVVYSCEQLRMVSGYEVGAPDAAVEQDITGNYPLGEWKIEDNAAG